MNESKYIQWKQICAGFFKSQQQQQQQKKQQKQQKKMNAVAIEANA